MYAAILAGGGGTRLWPLSRASRPKHLLALVGERSLLRQTLDRVLPLVGPERVLVLAEGALAGQVREQLPEIPVSSIVAEPARRGTASSLGLAATMVHQNEPEAIMACLPADHLIDDAEEFRRVLLAAAEVAAEGQHLVALGVTPSGPATGFGYIRLGPSIGKRGTIGVHKVAQFVEKPGVRRARRYVESGEYLWNAGIFVWRVDTVLQSFSRYMPETYAGLKAIRDAAISSSWGEAIGRFFADLPCETVDYGIIEKADNVATVPVSFGWSDVGSWAELWQVLPRDSEGNAVVGGHVGMGTRGSMVWAPGRIVATVGVEDMVIVDTPQVVLVCPRSRAQDIKKLVERLQTEGNLSDLL